MSTRSRFSACCILVLLATGGCAPYAYVRFDPRVAPALGEMREDRAEITVHYATDRNLTHVGNPRVSFGAERTREAKLGRLRVSVPPQHGRGRTEEPGPLSPARPSHHVTLLRVDPPTAHADFFAGLREAISESHARDVLVFVHGYATTFDGNAVRLAQIAHDLELDGPVVLYTWPTRGSVLSYFVDGANAEWSAAYLAKFLADLTENCGDARIHILAHSMGARVLSYALRTLAADHATPDDAFGQILLAAADVDSEIFVRDFARYYERFANRTTIYISSADWALSGAQRLLGYARLGQVGLENADISLFDEFDVVDVTNFDRGFFGHSYYGSSPDVLADIQAVLRGARAQDRGHRRHFVYIAGE